MFRVGIGQDSHKIKFKAQGLRLKVKKPLILGGVLIDKRIGVEADSDGDVILHSLCNALNTAISLASFDIYAGAMCKKRIMDSREYLKIALKKVQEKGFQINNVAIMVEAEQPKLEVCREMITDSLAKILHLNKERIGLAFTSGDRLTSFGKGQGIQAFCLVSLIE